MANSPLQTVLANWQARAAQATAQGLPKSSWQPLAAHDIHNVMAGGAPMPSGEIKVALLSQALKTPVIKDPVAKTGWQNIPGNVASDVGGIITGFIPGLARYLYHLPSETTNTVRAFTDPQYAQQQGYEQSSMSPSGLAAAARNVAKLPLAGALPIVHTLANLTTSEGRKEIERHPVGTALDVLPVAMDAGKVAAGLKLGGEAAVPGSATEALSQGKLVRAGTRATLDSLGRLTNTDPRAVLNQHLTNLGVTPAIRENLARPFSVITRKAQRDALALWHNEIEPVVGKLSMEDRQALYVEAANYHPATQTATIEGVEHPVSPEHAAILDKISHLNETFFRKGEGEGALVRIPTGDGHSAIYPADDEVVQTYRKAQNQNVRFTNAMEKSRQAAEKVADREAALTARQGKVRGFYERPEDFAARPEGPVGIEVVRNALRPFVESFQHLDPRQVFQEYVNKIADGGVRAQTAARLSTDFNLLQGESGLVAKLDEALQARDIRSAQKAATQIARIFKHKGWDGFNTTNTLRSFMGDIRDELIGLNGRERTHGFAARTLLNAQKEAAIAQAKADLHGERFAARQQAHLESLTNNPPANFHPHLVNLVRSQATDAARQLYQGHQLDEAIRTLTESPSTAAMQQLVGKDEFNAIMGSAVKSWLDLQAAGLDPIWLHHVPVDKYETFMRTPILPDHLLEPGQWEKRVFNFGPGMQDIAASVTSAGVELIRASATREFINNWVMKFAESKMAKEEEYRNMVRDDPRVPTSSVAAEAKRRFDKEYEAFDPEKYGVRRYINVNSADSLVVPKGVARSLRMMEKQYKLPLSGVYSKALNVYKFSVLTGPRHMVHVGIGGLTMAMLREPRTLLYLREASRMIREGQAPVDLLHSIYDLPTDGVFHFAAGKTIARHFAEFVGDKATALARFEERVASMERVATMLAVEGKGLSRDIAMREALKVYIDMDGMAPIERTVIRNIFPFYAFTKHIFRYLFTYPVDHPVRAAILARFGAMEQRDWDNGLPKKYQQIFFLGSPDSHGNVLSVDFKSINPFRSISNDFSLAGFLSSLNPIITAPFAAAGVNTLSATPELYPELAYDTTTGTLTAKRRDVIPTFISQFIPEYGLIDHFVNQTDRMRNLKANSPDAYRRQLFSALNLPFATTNTNIPYEQEHTQINRYKGAQAAISGAKRSQDFAEVNRYNAVPVNGQLTSPSTFQTQQEKLAAALAQAGISGINPNAIAKPVRKRG